MLVESTNDEETMPRAKKAKDQPVAIEPTPAESSRNSATVSLPPVSDAIVQSLPTSESPSEGEPQAPAARGQFRSWVVDMGRGYTRLTDETNHRLVLQFHEKPQPDVLTALKGAGFEFKPDYYGQKNAWVRRNDFEGRLQVEAIEKLFAQAGEGRESAVR
ncbi:MAG: hypothetical protein JSS49_28860 [Planctomycetes bacterium]|nr:hypothetical protein [Planctomycetota bacterium]